MKIQYFQYTYALCPKSHSLGVYCLGCTVAKIMRELNICLGWEDAVESLIDTVHLLLKLEPSVVCSE